MAKCELCPRSCFADRSGDKLGFCKAPSDVMVARAALHYWEEPCISGERGSGTVFFSGCPLGCVYCQNRDIASGKIGKKISPQRLTEIFFELKSQGAHNVNLVTPTHYAPQIKEAITAAKDAGIGIPFVYNTGGYEKLETLKSLCGSIDVYLPDLKYFSPILSQKYSNAGDYFKIASAAIDEMVKQTGAPQFDGDMMIKGTIVRHMVLPDCTDDSIKIIEYLWKAYGNDIYVSIMNQYTPMHEIDDKYPELSRKISESEYDKVIDRALELGITHAYVQDGETASESFIPSFDCEGV